MLIRREDFIRRYTEILKEKVERELVDKLPEDGFLAEQIPAADKIVIEMMRKER
jgi:hypothetical protein